MPINFTQEIISQVWSSGTLRSVLTTKLVSIGYTLEESSGDDLFFSFDAPLSGAPKDRIFLRVKIESNTATNLKIQSWFGDGINGTTLLNQTNSFNDNQSGAANIGFNANESFPIRFCSFSSQEVRVIGFLRNDNNSGLSILGFFFPLVKPAWWSSASIYGFAAGSSDCNSLRGCILNPVSPSAPEISYNLGCQINAINPGGGRDVVPRPILSCSAGFILGQFSSDVGILAANGLSPFSQHNQGAEAWLPLKSGSSLALRIL